MHRLVIHGAEREARLLAAVDDAQPVDHERAAMWDRDALPDSRGPQALALLEQAVEVVGLLADAEEIDHLAEGLFLRLRLQIEIDLVVVEELDELHRIGIPGA